VRPAYATTKRTLWLNCIMAWLVIVMLAAGAVMGSDQAVAFGTIAVPSMVGLIGVVLGIHRHYGSKDFAATQEHGEPHPPFHARADPEGGA